MEWNVQFWRPHGTGGTQNCLKNYPCLWRNFSNLITWNRVMAWNGQFWRQHRVLSMQNNCLKSFVCEGIIQIWQHGTELWHQLFNFKDNMQLYVLKTTVWKKLSPACEWLLQIWPLGTELWDKTFNFEDNIGLLVPKTIVWKTQPLLVNDFFNSEHLEWSNQTKHSILKIAYVWWHSNWLSAKNMTPACKRIIEIWPLGTEL